MSELKPVRIAILYPGDMQTRQAATHENNRFAPLFQELIKLGGQPEPAVYHDEFCEEVYQQLLQVDSVLVWVNPIQNGCDRTMLDAMLRKVAQAGVFVSAHPDIIQKIGTKEVLFETRSMGWGSDIRRYQSLDEMHATLPDLLWKGQIRVLKQHRGQSGSGVWKIERFRPEPSGHFPIDALVRVRHAQRGAEEEVVPLGEFFGRYESYLAEGGMMIDQPYQSRLAEGMFRCYMVHDQVAGFGHQAINALFPEQMGETPQPGPRLYYSADMPEAQLLKREMETEWLPELQKLLSVEAQQLPVLWDADFLLGPKTESGEDSYVLCEINVSSVAPYPDSATPLIAQAILERFGSSSMKSS
ncbi:MAG: Cj0069 family protein [Anaerolineae bacterium]